MTSTSSPAAAHGAPTARTIHVVPHTHWDREWYRPFQSFRMQLVDLVDGVLDMLDADPRFAFTLDGQLSTIDDYLEVRPDGEERIRRHVASGRLAIGPWLILMDEFLCSGETMIRNLEAGMARAAELGGGMSVGYLPDMFGHVAQMPQLLRRAGIESAVLWRGVPEAVDHHRFVWSAPDGSTVRGHYLVHGYGSGAYLFNIPARLADRVGIFEELMDPFFGSEPLLAMYGTDHMAPVPELVTLVADLNDAQDRHALRLDTLADYVADASGRDWTDAPRVRGELRSSARANILMGVTSARIDLKQATGRAERALERYAEPLQALWGAAEQWPERYLELAWRRVIENSAHDSICGCSVDPVVDQVLVRYAEAEQIATDLAGRAGERVAAAVPRGALAVLNPSPLARSGLVDLSLTVPETWSSVALEAADGTRHPTQELGRNEPLVHEQHLAGHRVPEIFRRIHGRELFGRFLRGFAIEERDGHPTVTLEVDAEPDPEWLDVDDMKHAILAAIAAAPDATWHVRVAAAARRRMLAHVNVSALGHVALRPVEGDSRVAGPIAAGHTSLDNGRLRVDVEPEGTLRLAAADGTVLSGVGRLVDGGDYGDSYNWAPPAEDRLVDEPVSVSVRLRGAGPLCGALEVERTYRWPAAVERDGSARTEEDVEVTVLMRAELRADEPFVRLTLTFRNPADDHRLRLHVPLARAAATVAAEGQFAVVERSNETEAGHGEVPLPTYPARTFCAAGGAAILTTHVVEHELLDGRELAITILRATALLSRNDNPYREDPAGPQLRIPNGQCRTAWRFELAVMPHPGTWQDAGVHEAAEHYRHALLVAAGTAGEEAPLPAAAEGLAIEGAGVGLSSLRRRDDGWLELRVVGERPSATSASVRGGLLAARAADLLGHPGGALPLDGEALRLELEPWEIRTVQLRRREAELPDPGPLHNVPPRHDV